MQLKETGITVKCIHPGFVKTTLAQSDYHFPMNIVVPIVGFFIGESPEQAADTPVWLALSNQVKDISGEYVHHRKVKKSGPPTSSENVQKHLFGEVHHCAAYECALGKGLQFCGDCDQFPCDSLHPYADKAVTLPHNINVFNLCPINKMGLEK